MPHTRGKKGVDDARVQDGEQAYLEKNFTLAREIWEPIAEAGDAEAEGWLGALYANGLGVDKDAARAFAYYLRSAEHGNPLAANNVGAMYAKGDGVATDPARGVSGFSAQPRAATPWASSITP